MTFTLRHSEKPEETVIWLVGLGARLELLTRRI